ncbi:MAG: cryptochrome/photolyase family protein [Magnetococcales bacterium]|nr:cryptochrome/photolyase family protein [Magnetococcales bacterium]|tara:strand:- start:41018 stop:42538 length:1521 start_codon:yes stop_codon:yes gene_type:complete
MKTLRLILGDQLSHNISSLSQAQKGEDIVFMCEVMREATYVKHHKKKIVFLFSAMRHFAQELKQNGHQVVYTQLDDPNNAGSFKGELKRQIKEHNIDKIVVTQPGEHRVLEDMQSWQDDLGVAVDILDDDRFLCTLERFEKWAKGRKQLRMELFYREMRKEHNILMNGDEPEGGKWNYDAENRKPPEGDLFIPQTYQTPKSDITQQVIQLVEDKFADHFGDIEPFFFAVTRAQALEALEKFIQQRLENFGDFQDAMVEGQPWMYHAHISFYINCGLLNPKECIDAAIKAYQQNKAPLNAVEGFVRQILGWREYVRGIYWLKMPEYTQQNFFNAQRPLPQFYWDGNTKMNCLKQCVTETKQNAYAHHIQRLMVLGNFALLAGLNPKEVNEWYLLVYADAYEWVELPNVSGMILFADGGYLASKPYAAGGNYINKMSNYCQNCQYNIKDKTGAKACPFNYLYWDFLARNQEKLKSNHRLGMIYNTYNRMSDDKKQTIQTDSQKFLDCL